MTWRDREAEARRAVAAEAQPTGRRPHRQGPVRVELPEDVLALLGRVPDPELAAVAGVGAETIRRRRIERGLPTWQGRRDSARLEDVGRMFADGMTDAEIAGRLGYEEITVTRLRYRLGLLREPARGTAAHHAATQERATVAGAAWAEKLVDLLDARGEMSIADIVRETGHDEGTIGGRLHELEALGIVVRVGRGAWTRWRVG